MGNPAVVTEIKNMRENQIMNPDVEDVADYKTYYKRLKAQDDEIKRMLDKAKKEINLPEKLYDNPFDAREAGDKEDRAMYRDMEKTNIPVKKTNNSIDLDVEAIKKLIEKKKKEKEKRAKGGIAGVL